MAVPPKKTAATRHPDGRGGRIVFPKHLAIALVIGAMAHGLAPSPTRVMSASHVVLRPQEPTPESGGPGYVIRIPLPLTSQAIEQIERQLHRIADTANDVVRPEHRPIVILKFDTANNKTGRGSALGASLELARLLVSPDLNRIRTVAFVPAAAGGVASDDSESPELRSQLMGHPVLVALAADDLVVADHASIGRASIDEGQVSRLVREVYRDIASRRLTLPLAVVDAMVDPSAGLFRVTTDEGVVFVGAEQLEQLEADGRVIATTTLCPVGQIANLTGEQLERWELTRTPASDLNQLARRLNLDPEQLNATADEQATWSAVQVQFPEYLDAELANWVFRSLNQQLSRNKTSLVIFRFDTANGDLAGCLKMARRIAELDPDTARTVAYLEGPTGGPAAVVALACDHILVHSNGVLGGDFAMETGRESLADARLMARNLLEMQGRHGALGESVLDPERELILYRNRGNGRTRLMFADEAAQLPNADRWVVERSVDMRAGLRADELVALGIARRQVEEFDQLLALYDLESTPPALQPTELEKWLKRVASMLASPFVAPWLLFAAVFFLSTEMSAPGVGVPGFLGTVCLVLFFWSQFLDGNADWLEILIFATGVVFILMEMFLLPGFGIFGVGGILMVVAALILASQDFLIPMNSQQFQRLSLSILPVVGAGAGFFTAMYVIRKALPNTPYLNRLMLPPPERETDVLHGDRDPEMLVDWSDLEGRRGETISKLVPAGKARIGDRIYDVISDGRMIDRGVTIVVDRVVGNRIEVSEVKSSDA